MKVVITRPIFCNGGFRLLVDDEYPVQREFYSNEKKQNGYLVQTKVVRNGVKLPIVVYENECVIKNKKL